MGISGGKFVISISIFLFYPITLGGRRGTTDEFATIPFHLDLFSAALVELAKSIPVHSLILSSHLFFCLPLFLFPFTVPCRIVFAKPEELETWPNHLSFRLMVWPCLKVNLLFASVNFEPCVLYIIHLLIIQREKKIYTFYMLIVF